MRVSSSQIYDTGTLGILNNQASLYKTQNQLSTGRRVVTPEDDPVAASQALVVTQSKSVNTQYKDNQGAAKTQLSLSSSVLGNVTDVLQSVLEKVVQAGNDTFGVSDRKMIATELQSQLDNLVSMANTQDGSGKYIFAGFQTQTMPFQVSANVGPYTTANPRYTYNGDEGQQKLQVDSSLDMSISDPGSEVFVRVRDSSGNLTGTGMFDAMQNMIDALNNPGAANFRTTYSQAFSDIKSSLDTVLKTQTDIGTRLSALDGLGNMADDLNLQYTERLSNLIDLDYVSAITDLNKQQMQLQAAQKSFSQTSQLSLFSVL